MTNFDDTYIDRYLLNQLSENEKIQLEEKLEVDTMLRQKIQVQKKLMQATKLAGRSETIAQIKTVTKNWEQYVPELSEANLDRAHNFKQSLQTTAEELVALVNQFFRPYSVSFRDALTETSTIEENAFNLYAKKDYEKALPLLKQISPNNKEAKLILGNTLFIMEQFEAAYPHFAQLIDEKAIGYVSDAHWYAGLTLLKLSEIKKAKAHFQKIIVDEYVSKKTKQKALEILETVAKISR